MEPMRYDLRLCDGDSGRCRAEMEESEDGDYMSYESYAAQVAEIERLTADVEFWKSAAEAQRRKNCDECVRIAEGEMVAKLQVRVAELEKFEASMRCPNCDNLRLEIGQLRRRVAELEVYREICVDLRAKVERGEAKSVRTYGRIVDAMSKEVGHDG